MNQIELIEDTERLFSNDEDSLTVVRMIPRVKEVEMILPTVENKEAVLSWVYSHGGTSTITDFSVSVFWNVNGSSRERSIIMPYGNLLAVNDDGDFSAVSYIGAKENFTVACTHDKDLAPLSCFRKAF